MLVRQLPEPSVELRNALRENRAVAVLGSGLSSAAGAPTWIELLQHIAGYAYRRHPNRESTIATCLHEIQQHRLLAAADMLKEVLGTSEFLNAIRHQFEYEYRTNVNKKRLDQAIQGRNGRAQLVTSDMISARHLVPTLAHRILSKLGFRAFVTTNYDSLLEQAWGYHPALKPPPVFSWSEPEHIASCIRSGEPFILKLHGDLSRSHDILLARSDFVRIDPATRAAVETLSRANTLFWIGYGFADPDLEALLEANAYSFRIANGFGVVQQNDEGLIRRFAHLKIDYAALASYDEVPAFLQQLAVTLERPVVFSVRMRAPAASTDDADRIGKQFAAAINRFGEIDFWRSERTSGQLYLECIEPVRRGLLQRLHHGDKPLWDVILDFGLSEYDGHPVATFSPLSSHHSNAHSESSSARADNEGGVDAVPRSGLQHRPHPDLFLRNIFAIRHENTLRDQRMAEILEAELAMPRPDRALRTISLLARTGFNYLHPKGANFRAGFGKLLDLESHMIRVVLEYPDSVQVQARMRAAVSMGATRKEAERNVGLEWWHEIPRASNIEVRLTTNPVYCSVFITPDLVVYDPYHLGTLGHEGPSGNEFLVFEFERPAEPDRRGLDYYRLFTGYFDFLWNDEVALRSVADIRAQFKD
jgi:hypothetical protein